MDVKRYCVLLSLGLWLAAAPRASAASYGYMDTKVNLDYRNESTFMFIQEDHYRPGTVITILSHAIVEFHIDDPQNLRLVAGLPNQAGLREGSGANIRFSNPWDLVQLNQNSWIISDSDNNCLRNFDPSKNLMGQQSAINAWSAPCNLGTNASSVYGSISQSLFHKPRGLTYVEDDNKMYVTYEKPYAIAEISLRSGIIRTLYSSSTWQLRRIIAFHDELIISTEPKYYMFSYRDKTLGATINEEEWRSNIPSTAASSEPYAAGLIDLPGSKQFMETISNGNVLAFIDQESKVITKVCTGERGNIDTNLSSCKLDKPAYITRINNTLYIGESGWSGGGIRVISIYEDEPPIKSAEGLAVKIGIAVAAVFVVVVVAIVVGILAYRRKKQRQRIAPPIPGPRPNYRPTPAPRTYTMPTNNHLRAAEADQENEYEYILSQSESGYEHPVIHEPRGYNDLTPTEEFELNVIDHLTDKTEENAKTNNTVPIYVGSVRTLSQYQGPYMPKVELAPDYSDTDTSEAADEQLTVDLSTAPEKEPGPTASEKKTEPTAPEEEPVSTVSEKEPGPIASEKKIEPTVPEKETGATASEKKTGPAVPEKKTGLTASQKKTGPTVPKKKTGSTASEKKTGLTAPEKKTGPTASEEETEPTASEKESDVEKISNY